MPDIDFQKIVLNLIPKKGDEPVIFYASQYETARPFIADLMWGDTEFAPGDDCWAEIDIRKVDDNLVVITDDISIDNNEVSVVLPVQAVTCVGKNFGQVKIFADDDHLVAALNFILEVQPDPLAGGVTSETAIDNLESQIAAIVPEVIGEDYYDKTEVDALLADKADVSDLPDMSQYYTKTATDTLLNAKADKTDTYTKAQVDSALALKADTSSLATVATTGDYDDLINKPTIPAAQVQADYTQADTTAVDYIKNKPDIDAMIAAALLAVMPVDSATGNPCTFDTDIAVPLKSLSAEIVASGGNGTPATPIPIVGHSELNLVRCGVNLWDEEIESGYINSSTGAEVPDSLKIRMKNYVKVAPNTTYFYKTPVAFYICCYDENKTFLGRVGGSRDTTFTTLPNTAYIRCGFESAYGTTYNHDISINYPSTDTSYHAYNGTPYLVQFGQTVYGGVYDANRGKVRITHGYILVDENTPSLSYNGASSETVRAFIDVTGKAFGDSNILSDRFQLIEGDVVGRFTGRNNSNGVEFYLPATVPLNTAGIKAWFEANNTQLVYELATPIEIDVSAISVNAISGVNNITSNGNGDITAQYKVSIQKYIDDHV